MKLYQIAHHCLVDQLPEDPHELFDRFFSAIHFREWRRILHDMLRAAFTRDPSEPVRARPDRLSWHFKCLAELVIAAYLVVERKQYPRSTMNTYDGTEKIHPHRDLSPFLLTREERDNPHKVLEESFLLIPLEQWLEFLHVAESSALAFDSDGHWEGMEHQGICCLYVFKLVEAGFLIYKTGQKTRPSLR